jgi:DNA-binding response OmpR family regulator
VPESYGKNSLQGRKAANEISHTAGNLRNKKNLMSLFGSKFLDLLRYLLVKNVIMKILVVEDEANLAGYLKKGLEEEGHDIMVAGNCRSAKEVMRPNEFELVLLDLILPDGNGLLLCQDFKKLQPHLPILVLTSLGSTEDKVSGLDAGADDYLVKPFQFSELAARIRVIERRKKLLQNGTILKIADLTLDAAARTVTRGNKSIALTSREFKLLKVFIENKDVVLSRMEIAEKVWEIKFDTGTNVVDVYVNYLRNKIDKGFDIKLIHTIIGVGYVLRSE